MKLRIIIILAVFVLCIFQISISIFLAGEGGELTLLSAQAAKLEDENREIQSQLNEEVSLSNVASKAAALGYSKAGDFLYISNQRAVAQNMEKRISP